MAPCCQKTFCHLLNESFPVSTWPLGTRIGASFNEQESITSQEDWSEASDELPHSITPSNFSEKYFLRFLCVFTMDGDIACEGHKLLTLTKESHI